MNPKNFSRHDAMTLLEVVLALAILAGSMAVLAQLVGLGMRAADQSRELTDAQLIAETTMSEIAAGITPAQSYSGMEIAEYPDWQVSATVNPSLQSGMLQVTLVVERPADVGRSAGRSARYTMSRWLRDPSVSYPEDLSAYNAAGTSVATASAASTTSGSQGANDAAAAGFGPGVNAGAGAGGQGPGRGGRGPGGGGRGGQDGPGGDDQGGPGQGGPGGPGRGGPGQGGRGQGGRGRGGQAPGGGRGAGPRGGNGGRGGQGGAGAQGPGNGPGGQPGRGGQGGGGGQPGGRGGGR